MRRPEGHARLARFQQAKAEPERTVGLAADHPAVVEGRTLFPNRVARTEGSMRFLVSGVNNAKIGKTVEKGPWAGMPVFTLTLEERKTCPRSCEVWRDCYGNSQQWPNRWDHTDPEFLPTLAAEVVTLGRQNPKGFVVRLHVLGDFYSVEYVLFWAELLARVPSLRIYGYTARTVADADRDSARIARAIELLTLGMWSRFAVRTSTSQPIFARSRAIVVETPEEAAEEGAILCPSQTSQTETCGTCALCWADGARDKTIAFLRHGMKRASGPRLVKAVEPAKSAPAAPVSRPSLPLPARREGGRVAASQTEDEARLLAVLDRLGARTSQVRASIAVLADQSGIPKGSIVFVLRRLVARNAITITRGYVPESKKPATNSYRIVGSEPVEASVTTPRTGKGAPDRLYEIMASRCDADGYLEARRSVLCAEAGVPVGTWHYSLGVLKADRRLGIARNSSGGSPTLVRLYKPDGSHVVGSGQSVLSEAPSIAPSPPAPEPPKPRLKESTLWEPVADPKPAPKPTVAREPEPPPAPVVVEPKSEPLELEIDATPGSLMSLRLGMCKWPMNSPAPGAGHLTRFCCKDAERGEPYCPAHQSVAAGKGGGQHNWSTEQRAAAAARLKARMASRSALKAAGAHV